MSLIDQEINIAIAEFYGFKRGYANAITGCWTSPSGCLVADIPSYCTDLNAMHEAENLLNGQQQINFCENLDRIIFGGGFIVAMSTRFHVAHCTARQRAEALLRTIGKWREV